MIAAATKFGVAPFVKWPLAVTGFFGGVLAWYQGLAQPWQIVVWLVVFILIDTVTGICAAAAMAEPWETSKLKRLVVKTIAYFAMPIVVYGITEITRMPDPPRTAIETGSLTSMVCIEGLSIVENIVKMRVKNLGPLAKGVAGLLRLPLSAWLRQMEASKGEQDAERV